MMITGYQVHYLGSYQRTYKDRDSALAYIRASGKPREDFEILDNSDGDN